MTSLREILTVIYVWSPMKIITAIHALVCIAFTGVFWGFNQECWAQNNLTKTQLLADLDQFEKELPAKHKNLFYKISEQEFKNQVVAIRNEIDQLDQVGFTMRLSKILSAVGDGHTNIKFDYSRFHFFPVNFKVLADGIFVRSINEQNKGALAARLVSIGGIPVDEIRKRLGQLLPHDNLPGLNNMLDNQMNTAEFLQAIGAANRVGTTEFLLEKDGGQLKVPLKPVSMLEARGRLNWAMPQYQVPLYQQKSQLSHWNDWIADHKTIYFKYNRCRDAAGFNKLVNGTIGFIQQNDVQRFVLDLRDNGGGDSRIFAPLLQYIKSNKNLNQKGRLFVITGRRTFSSAVLNTIDMKQNTNAITVGEATGGKPNHFGEVKTFQLSNTKLNVQYSTKHFTRIKGSNADSMTPDVVVDLDSKSWFKGEDPFLDAALNYGKK